MPEKTVPATSGKQEAMSHEKTRTEELYIQPPVDIYETQDGLILLADLPGVAPGDLNVRLEDNILTIRAKPQHAIAADPIYREFELANFFRQFELSDQVNQENISARLNNGVLVLEMPKAEKAKPKQITVQFEKAAA